MSLKYISPPDYRKERTISSNERKAWLWQIYKPNGYSVKPNTIDSPFIYANTKCKPCSHPQICLHAWHTTHTHTHLQHPESLSQHSRLIRCQVHNTIWAAQQTEEEAANLIVPLMAVYLPQNMKCSRSDAVNILYTEEDWFIAICCIYENWANWVAYTMMSKLLSCNPALSSCSM